MASEQIVIWAGTLVDGSGAAPIHDVEIVLEDGRISNVQPGAAQGRPNRDVLDARGATVVPGLINAHEHLSFKRRRGSVAEMMRESSPFLILQAAQSARWDLQHGITSVRSVGDKDFMDVTLRRAIEQGIAEGPRIVAAGPPLLMTGGHGYPIGTEVDGPDNVRRAARANLKAGADFIKLIASGGIATTKPGEEPLHVEFTVEEMRAAVEEAHKVGRRVAAHCHGPEATTNALDAGVDSIEHGTLLTRELAQRMRQDGTYLVPTLSQFHQFAHHGVELGKPRSYQEGALAILPAALDAFQYAISEGVKIVTGTDGVGDLVEEIEIFVRAGIAPVEAIRAATGRAAELLGLNAGVVRPGALADLLIVDGDPVANPAVLRQVRAVISRGRMAVDIGTPLAAARV